MRSPPKKSEGIDCNGCLVVACFSDSHTHLAHAHPRAERRWKINGALAQGRGPAALGGVACCGPCFVGGFKTREKVPRPRSVCEADDVKRRMGFGPRQPASTGRKPSRTHLDGTAADDQKLVNAVRHSGNFERARRRTHCPGANLYFLVVRSKYSEAVRRPSGQARYWAPTAATSPTRHRGNAQTLRGFIYTLLV